jgi:hypothetical protein
VTLDSPSSACCTSAAGAGIPTPCSTKPWSG